MKRVIATLLLALPLTLTAQSKEVEAVFGTEEPPGLPKTENQEEPLLTGCEIDPEFPGGHQALTQYIANNLQLPPVKIGYQIEGKVYLKFIVKADGTVTNVTVQKGIPECPECDQAAIRVVEQMPKWIPKKVKGKPVAAFMYLPIKFAYPE